MVNTPQMAAPPPPRPEGSGPADAATAVRDQAAEAWAQGYRRGIEDERTAELLQLDTGMGGRVGPARQNPYGSEPQPVCVQMPALTALQELALEELVATARAHGVAGITRDRLDIVFDPERRPGRGHDVQVWWEADEQVVNAWIDVYGKGSGPSIGEVSWQCVPAGEDRPCPTCNQPCGDCAKLEDSCECPPTTNTTDGRS